MLGGRLNLAKLPSVKPQRVYQFAFPQKRSFWDFFFKSFLTTCLWVGVGIFSGVFISEASVLVFQAGTLSSFVSFLNFIFASLVFFVWYYLFFR
jgi:hypothetical protein